MSSRQNTKILIVEDELIIAEYFSDLLQEAHFSKIKIAKNKETALKEMASFLPDIILMDININERNAGIELSTLKNRNATVIFITGQHDVALMSEALKTNPDAYLTKPINKVDLIASVNLAIQKKQQQVLQFKDGYDTINLEYKNIKYIIADGNYVNIITTPKKYTIRQSLTTIAEKLPIESFVQTHRSYLVNRSKIQRITATSVFVNDVEIPLSRSFSKHFK